MQQGQFWTRHRRARRGQTGRILPALVAGAMACAALVVPSDGAQAADTVVSVANVNFQPAGSPVPSGYLADSGAAYASRGNGQTYGWNVANTANTRDRNAIADQRYDTLIHMQKGGTFSWEIAVPNGSYIVRVVAGDPSYTDSIYKIAAEGVLTVDGTPTSSSRFVEGTKTVTVADGRLTLTSASGSSNNKLAFVEISSTTAPPPPPPAGCTNISPLTCSEVLVNAPYQLNFSAGAGKIADQSGAGTGFTMVDPPSHGTGYLPANLHLNTTAPGTLEVRTTKGLAFTTANSQDNALGVGIHAADQISVVTTTLRNPPAGTGQYEQAGLWYGTNEDNYLKLTVQSAPGGTRIEFLKEIGGQQIAATRTGALNLSSSAVALTLRADPGAETVTASYRVNGGASKTLSVMAAPADFFNADGATIDPTIGTRVFTGIMASHRNAASGLTYAFDDFSLLAESTTPPPPPSGFNFTKASIPVPNPTSMVWGPDGRLYVTELLGNIHALTLGASKQLVNDQVITTLGNRLALGLAVDPASTPTNVILWVSHSDPNLSNNAAANSSMVSRLSGSGLSTRQDVITGLPRSKANHSVNSIHFGSDGKLYIAQGGNTGAGAPNNSGSAFGDRAEQPLSAAILVADVKAVGFDGSCATPLNSFGPSPCDVTPYATGLRNSYDFVFHSNGSMYATDNGLGVEGSFPPSPTAPCTGIASTESWTTGGQNPGEQPDLLQRVVAGKYYGHPNPYRNQCVFKNGSYQGVAPAPNYVEPFFSLGVHKSSDGIIEYRGDAFGGALRGQLLIANYSQGNDITRVQLAADGKSVLSSASLVGSFSDPLPLAQSPDGTIFVGEFGSGKVTALIPAP
jgi:glucose/arabinose dehydrogenase